MDAPMIHGSIKIEGVYFGTGFGLGLNYMMDDLTESKTVKSDIDGEYTIYKHTNGTYYVVAPDSTSGDTIYDVSRGLIDSALNIIANW